jgi:hypothetical protein
MRQTQQLPERRVKLRPKAYSVNVRQGSAERGNQNYDNPAFVVF